MTVPPRDVVDTVVGLWLADGTATDPSAVALFTRLGMVGRAVVADKERAAADLGVSGPVVETLYALRRRGRPYRAGPTDLARELGLSQAAMTARIRSLASDGLVTTAPDPDDGRRLVVRLTRRGHALTERVFRRQTGIEEALLAHLDPQDRAALDRALRALVAALPPDRRLADRDVPAPMVSAR